MCRVVTQFRARREAAPEVVTAPEVTPKATGPEVIAPTAPETEVVAEGGATASEPAGAREEPPLDPATDPMEDYVEHVSVVDFSSVLSCIFIGCATVLPMGVAPEATCDCMQ